MSSKPYVIVVGMDYSQPADKAFVAAYQLARQHAPAELHAVHVSVMVGTDMVPLPLAGVGGLPLPTLDLDELKAGLVRHLDSLIPQLSGFRESGVRIFAHVALAAPPSSGVTQLASDLEANMIVVGSHGRRGLAHLLLGSVAESVLKQATCPVLVIPVRQAQTVPAIEPPCPLCVDARAASNGTELWCEQHRERHGRRHTYYQADRVAAESNLPLTIR